MAWRQAIDPLQNLPLSALSAVIPILFIFWALIIKKMKGYQASLMATGIAIVVAIAIYKMPVNLAVLSAANGALYGLFPICWIIIAAVFLFNLTVKSGQFDIIRHFMAGITSGRRLQALLIAFSFGSFLEGTAGFGAPVAITAAMLVGLGFDPLYAAGLCLIANTAPVAFGSIGIPITVASQVSGIPEMAISKMVGRTLPILSIFIPFYSITLLAGYRKAIDILPAVLVSGCSFALLQWFSSNYLGPSLPDVIAGIGSIIVMIIFLRFWKPKTAWRFPHDPLIIEDATVTFTTGQLIRAWAPFILLTILIIVWGIQPIKNVLNSLGMVQFNFPGLHEQITDATGKPLAHTFKFNYLSAAGTATFIAALISIPVTGLSFRQGMRVLAATLRQLRFPILTVASVSGFAYIVNDSGISLTMAATLANTGYLFPLFAPLLGWLGVFITGSDTSSNALFGKLQATTATTIGVDPVITVGANISGGVVGKMISPQSIAVAAAAGNLVGKEAALFRFTVKHSFIMLAFISCLVFAQAYALHWLVPAYDVAPVKTLVLSSPPGDGYIYLAILCAVLLLFSIAVIRMVKKPPVPQAADLPVVNE